MSDKQSSAGELESTRAIPQVIDNEPQHHIHNVRPKVIHCGDDDCSRCKQHFRFEDEQLREARKQYRGPNLTPEEAFGVIAKHRKSIDEHTSYITERLKDYGDAVVSKWKKKSIKERIEILVSEQNLRSIYQVIDLHQKA
jgi:hypothetical protein